MPEYDSANFDPPAPVAYVTLRNPATGVSVSDVPMLIDTGADITLVPDIYIEKLGEELVAGALYEVQGFAGDSSTYRAVELEMIFLGKKFTGQFLTIGDPVGILGRNILNAVSLLFDGPRQRWEEKKR